MTLEFIPGIVEGGVHRAGARLPLIKTIRLTPSTKILALLVLLLFFYKSPFLFCYSPHHEHTDPLFSRSSQSSTSAEGLTQFRHLK